MRLRSGTLEDFMVATEIRSIVGAMFRIAELTLLIIILVKVS